MKELFLSVFLAISSFLGFNKEQADISNAEITPTVIEQELLEEVPIITIEPTLVPTKKVATPTTQPISLINREVLETFFNMSNDHEINLILEDKNKINEYEKYYYEKHKKLPIVRLKIVSGKKYGLPSKNGMVICTSTQLQELYNELKSKEDEVYYQQMDFKCHYGRGEEKETQECQDWRRDHDQNRIVPTKFNGSINQEIAILTSQLAYKTSNTQWDSLLEKYCK